MAVTHKPIYVACALLLHYAAALTRKGGQGNARLIGCQEPRKLAVLISGQMQRFMWQDQKLPLVNASDAACPPQVDVYIALQLGEKVRIYFADGETPVLPYVEHPSKDNITEWYKSKGARNVQIVFVDEDALNRLVLPQVLHTYAKDPITPTGKSKIGMVFGLAHESKSPVFLDKVRQNHRERWEANAKMLYLRHQAYRMSVMSGEEYDGYAYWREDNYFFSPLAEDEFPRSNGNISQVRVSDKCTFKLPNLYMVSDKIFIADAPGAAMLFEKTEEEFMGKMVEWVNLAARDDDVFKHFQGPWRYPFQTEHLYSHMLWFAKVIPTHMHRSDLRYIEGRRCIPSLYWSCYDHKDAIGHNITMCEEKR